MECIHTEAARRLEHLASRPPQTLLIEGGTEASRLDLALYWAATINCPNASKTAPKQPCLECSICTQILANENLDLLIYDGRIANKQDEEKPGPIKSLRMDNMRELKSMVATAPHGPGKRVAIFQGMSQTREEALNSLLKTLEEPTSHTLFVLLTPQREQLLQTLVSRSFCITLPWTNCLSHNDSISTWENELNDFLSGGIGFLDHIAARGALDSALAGQILICCQKALGRIVAGKSASPLDATLYPLTNNEEKVAQASRWLSEAQSMLAAAVSPPRVLEAFSTRLYTLLHQ